MKPIDIVISKIKELISSGQLIPGDKLPAERKLSLEFGIGRTHVREALQKLEFFGIVKTLPQSGTVVNGLDIKTLDGLISDVLNLQQYDFFSLVETRLVLEVEAARLCAQRRNHEDLLKIELAHQQYLDNYNTVNRISADFAFHRAIAEGSHNHVIKALLLVVIPDIMTVYNNERVCAPSEQVNTEHSKLLEAIRNKNSNDAELIMKKHLQGVVEFAKAKLG